MILITDANIVFSALIDPDCIIAEILKEEPNFQFTAPKFIKEEIKTALEENRTTNYFE
ncbi:hypothetical protein SAMN05444369_101105 [Capnocytophaga haemolytica]|uniref:PIN domain-containing protein n=1 Tax=Capnocytophaga haemolytica TaxID=45243 RepID=A0AAX2GVV7_9FLAO|nr:hypothetical protein [Capnocytophaga haemolytica]SFN62864.1 hypothetical protein SAMN05444369_101105 [Capnocytophaga haemolytica]SNV03795.1 Uncharacterised protein [Capnocytophaga haemolytica]